MPEITFEIDEATGEMTSDFQGISGPDCDAMQKLLEHQFGSASNVRIKPEDYYRTTVNQQQRVGRGPGKR